MPRFFFDFDVGDGVATDDEGLELADLQTARAEAATALAEISKAVLPGSDHSVITVDVRERDRVLVRLTMDFAAVPVGEGAGARERG